MPSKRFLQVLIVAEFLLTILGGVVSSFTESLLPSELQAYQQAVSEADYTNRERVPLAFSIVFLIVFLVSSIGLFLFWPPARSLYLASTFLACVTTPFLGPYVDAGWGQFFDAVAVMVSGVILALIYWSPLRQFYERPKAAA